MFIYLFIFKYKSYFHSPAALSKSHRFSVSHSTCLSLPLSVCSLVSILFFFSQYKHTYEHTYTLKP